MHSWCSPHDSPKFPYATLMLPWCFLVLTRFSPNAFDASCNHVILWSPCFAGCRATEGWTACGNQPKVVQHQLKKDASCQSIWSWAWNYKLKFHIVQPRHANDTRAAWDCWHFVRHNLKLVFRRRAEVSWVSKVVEELQKQETIVTLMARRAIIVWWFAEKPHANSM